MKLLTLRLLTTALIAGLTLSVLSPLRAFAAGSITPSGGGQHTVGQTFTVTVRAGGATFDSLQGVISVSGPVSIVSFSAGSATWLPGKSPSNGNQFVGITSDTSSLTVATIRLKGTKEGSGSVSVTGARLASSGSEVGTGGGSTSFTINRALTPPGGVTVKSDTHPDQEQSYAATTVTLNWDKGSGVDGFSYVFNQDADTVPAATINSTSTSVTYEKVALGTHYFHIRAHNGDGWGSTTHFKVNIKEPDPKVDDALAAPVITGVNKISNYVNNPTEGTLSGVEITGTGLLDYKVNFAINPGDQLPEGVLLSTDPDPTTGFWRLVIDKPMKAGFYTVTAQQQKEKALTPVSAKTYFEISVAEGGHVRVITENDKLPKVDESVEVLGVQFSNSSHAYLSFAFVVIFTFVVTLLAYIGRQFYKRFRSRSSSPKL